jgi:hypothetical protein
MTHTPVILSEAEREGGSEGSQNATAVATRPLARGDGRGILRFFAHHPAPPPPAEIRGGGWAGGRPRF